MILKDPASDSQKVELLIELAQCLYNAGFSTRRCLQPLDWAFDILLAMSAVTAGAEGAEETQVNQAEGKHARCQPDE